METYFSLSLFGYEKPEIQLFVSWEIGEIRLEINVARPTLQRSLIYQMEETVIY